MATDEEQSNKEFYKMADTFIDVANDHCENGDISRVGSVMLFATARFCSFVVASHARDLDGFEAEIDNAVDFFSEEYKRMLTQNLEDYKSAFTPQESQEEEAPKYEHLIKRDE